MQKRSCALAAALCAMVTAGPAHAKPIAFAGGTTTMLDVEANMIEAQTYYAPKNWWSIGPSSMRKENGEDSERHEMSYLQVNFLLQRWNLPDAQGNLFLSTGAGTSRVRERSQHSNFAWRETWSGGAGRITLQGDYETRQFYSSFKIDAHRSSRFSDRHSQVQLGVSPFPHDYDTLAVWLVAQWSRHRGIESNSETGGFVRLFKVPWWVEIGMTEGRKAKFMLMVNF